MEPHERRICCSTAAVDRRGKTERTNEDKAALSARILNDSSGVRFIQIRPKKGHDGRWSAFVGGMALRAEPAE